HHPHQIALQHKEGAYPVEQSNAQRERQDHGCSPPESRPIVRVTLTEKPNTVKNTPRSNRMAVWSSRAPKCRTSWPGDGAWVRGGAPRSWGTKTTSRLSASPP